MEKFAARAVTRLEQGIDAGPYHWNEVKVRKLTYADAPPALCVEAPVDLSDVVDLSGVVEGPWLQRCEAGVEESGRVEKGALGGER